MQFLFIAFLFGFSSADTNILNTKSGPIKGRDGLVQDVDAFLGIPFAEPPVGKLRFAKPVSKTPWNATYNATDFGPPCAQFSLEPYYFMPDLTNMSEDCLYLNVWVPRNVNSQDRRPILIFIHGGGFTTGATNLKFFDGSKLAKRGNMIVATISYRLGILGFLSGNIKEAPGNMGMYDQVMAIQWIKDNAKIFGGDPENLVMIGNSAGSFSISIHMVSPLSQHLFKRAIVESGSAINPYFFDNNAIYKNSKTAASIMKCTNDSITLKSDPRSVIECLKSKPLHDIIEAENIIRKSKVISFYPSVNDELLPKSAVDLLREGKFRKDMEVLIGINRDEGGMLLVIAMQDYFGRYGVNTPTMTKSRALMLARTETVLINLKNSSKIINFYFKQLKNKNSTGLTQMLGDILGDFTVACGTIFLSDFLSLKGNSVYFYKFEFRASSTPMAEWIGVTHVDELQYVFGNPFHENFTSEETELSNRLIDRWSAFARTGNPNIPGHLPWLRYNYHNRWYLNFGQEEESIRMDPLRRCEIWREAFRAEIDPPLIRFLRNSSTEPFLAKISVL